MQAYLDSIQQKTGKNPQDFRAEAKSKKLETHKDVVAWLKADYGLGHGHANLIAQLILKPEVFKAPKDEKIDNIFSGKKAVWRSVYQSLLEPILAAHPDITLAPTQTYVSLQRNGKKFAIFQPTTERLDLGLKLNIAPDSARLEPAGNWNIMVTHRVRLTAANTEVQEWLEQAYSER
jgi:predicted transport protein